MECIRVTMEEVTDVVRNIISEQKEAIVYCVQDSNWAIIGRNGQEDIRKAENLKMKYVQVNNEGGTIVTSPGDVDIGIFTIGYYGNYLKDEIVEKIINKVGENGYAAVLDGNDVLINDRKVVGFGSRMFGKILYTAIQISVDANLDLIRNICTKKSRKEPEGLNKYGISTQDIMEIMTDVIGISLQ